MHIKTRPSPASIVGASLRGSNLLLGLAAFTALNLVNSARATDYYWDTNGTTAGFGTADGTWGTSPFISTSSDGTSSTSLVTTNRLAYDHLLISGSAGTTVTVSGTQTFRVLNLEREGMTLTGGTLYGSSIETSGSQTINSILKIEYLTTVDDGRLVPTDVTLTGGGTMGFIFSTSIGFTDFTVLMATGNYSNNGSDPFSIGGMGSVSANTGGLKIATTATLTTQKMYVTEARASVEGGSLTSTTLALGASAYVAESISLVDVSAGTASVQGITFGGSYESGDFAVAGSNTLNVSGTGVLYVGSGGLSSAGAGAAVINVINLSGGIVGATASWVSSATGLPIVLTNSGAAGVTFQAANASNAAFNITLNGVISGSGGFTKTGGGTLLLNGANTYTGDSILNAGLTRVGASGKIGGNVIIGEGARLTLMNANALANNAVITFSSDLSGIITLSSGVDTIGGIYDSFTGIRVTTGTYTAGQLNTLFGASNFAGSGSWLVSAIPEPSTYALMAGGLILGVVAWNRRRRSSASASVGVVSV